MGSAFAGDHVTLTVGGADPSVLHVGDFLCDPAHPIPLATRVQGRIVVFNITVPLIKGAQVQLIPLIFSITLLQHHSLLCILSRVFEADCTI